MTQRFNYPFHTVESSSPSFDSTSGSASQAYALESTGLREWQGPSSRSVRVASKGADDYRLAFGDSTIVAESSGNMLVLGGTVETFRVGPSDTHVAIASSTDVEANFTIGYGR